MSDREEAKTEIELNRRIIFNTQQGCYTIGPFRVAPENRKSAWGDASTEDFEIRLRADRVRWFTLDNREFASSRPARQVHYCNSLSKLLLHTAQKTTLTDSQLQELCQLHTRLLETKVWAGRLYVSARKEIGEQFNTYKRK
ncbi:hypothetical protein SAMN05421823_11837 [Catalinimonas alkaloidigena]|uniref:Uncharacterized protein n=1 Tax=Catalinimonas alkaloidigena TaxID=1075417 RepID=A0A1G9UZ07_9BACT|nr:hypothetical protein [Catalinimonas alkaloidigena]SDM65016.1 hypothetical protein SAMN05421823_11837 [Catalinimonas alkaloidigena]